MTSLTFRSWFGTGLTVRETGLSSISGRRHRGVAPAVAVAPPTPLDRRARRAEREADRLSGLPPHPHRVLAHAAELHDLERVARGLNAVVRRGDNESAPLTAEPKELRCAPC